MVVYLDYSVSSGPFLRFSMRFEFLSEMFDHLVCETRDPSLTIVAAPSAASYQKIISIKRRFIELNFL